MDSYSDLPRYIGILRRGGLLVAPSDTVYGLVCDATNDDAVRKLITIKNRPFGKPISVFTSDMQMIDDLVEIGAHRDTLYTLLPGPFTIILPSHHTVSSLLESERGTLGVRLPQYPWIVELVKQYGKPLTATSANIFGRPPHYEAIGFMRELSAEKAAQIDQVIDVGKLPRNKPSSIVDLSGHSLRLLRKGDVMPLSTVEYRTETPQETRKTARFITESFLKNPQPKPLVFVLMGEMGAGKTVFAKGVGDALGVESVVSPTYVIYYEYHTKYPTRHTFVHGDLFNVEEPEEFLHLGLESYLTKGTVICIEWGEKSGPLFTTLAAHAQVVPISLSYVSESERIISVQKI
jgi:L-threonylcarbamoyladenylate synthase